MIFLCIFGFASVAGRKLDSVSLDMILTEPFMTQGSFLTSTLFCVPNALEFSFLFAIFLLTSTLTCLLHLVLDVVWVYFKYLACNDRLRYFLPWDYHIWTGWQIYNGWLARLLHHRLTTLIDHMLLLLNRLTKLIDHRLLLLQYRLPI